LGFFISGVFFINWQKEQEVPEKKVTFSPLVEELEGNGEESELVPIIPEIEEEEPEVDLADSCLREIEDVEEDVVLPSGMRLRPRRRRRTNY
jgi:hypothetical protein